MERWKRLKKLSVQLNEAKKQLTNNDARYLNELKSIDWKSQIKAMQPKKSKRLNLMGIKELKKELESLLLEYEIDKTTDWKVSKNGDLRLENRGRIHLIKT